MNKKQINLLYELLKEHEYIFIDEEFIDKDDIEDKITEYHGSYMCEDDKFITFPIYSVAKMDKPKLTTEYIGQILDDYNYLTENVWGEDLVQEDKEKLAIINELLHSMIDQLYINDKHLFDIMIYPEDDKFEIINVGEK